MKPFKCCGVERAVFPKNNRGWARRLVQICCWSVVLVQVLGAPALRAEVEKEKKPVPPKLDELIYNDGDRVRGHFVSRTGTTITFRSERFGELHVPTADAKVVLAVPVAAAAAVAAPPGPGPIMEADSIWSFVYLSPWALTKKLREFFGPWHGRFAFSTELISDTTERNNIMVEGHLQRKWTHDQVQLNARYDFSETNQVVTTDIMKADGSWRHDMQNNLFGLYHPVVEWNRAYTDAAGIHRDYLLLQQEIGAGINIFNKPDRQLRFGLSENLFNVWQTAPTETHSFSNVESAFVETEWKLPWKITVNDRGVFYHSFEKGTDGWENKFEIDKKLTETFTVGVRHEIRRNNPDLRVQDYRLLKLLLGIDF